MSWMGKDVRITLWHRNDNISCNSWVKGIPRFSRVYVSRVDYSKRNSLLPIKYSWTASAGLSCKPSWPPFPNPSSCRSILELFSILVVEVVSYVSIFRVYYALHSRNKWEVDRFAAGLHEFTCLRAWLAPPTVHALCSIRPSCFNSFYQ